jgi:hypothetical protein
MCLLRLDLQVLSSSFEMATSPAKSAVEFSRGLLSFCVSRGLQSLNCFHSEISSWFSLISTIKGGRPEEDLVDLPLLKQTWLHGQPDVSVLSLCFLF